MIYLTIDVHQDTMLSNEQVLLKPKTEFMCFIEMYNKVILENDIKVNLFITALSFLEHKDFYLNIANSNLIKIGAHGYDSYRFTYLNRFHPIHNKLVKKILNKYRKYGVFNVEELDVVKTLNTLRAELEVDTWRTHGYRSDFSLYKVLAKNDIRAVSDRKCKNLDIRLNRFGLKEFFINTPPDHEHLIHGTQSRTWSGDIFGSKRLNAEAYYENLLKVVKINVSNGLDSTILLHPNCQYMIDNNYITLNEFISNVKTIDVFSFI